MRKSSIIPLSPAEPAAAAEPQLRARTMTETTKFKLSELNSASLAEQIAVVSKNGLRIRYIANPSDAVQLAAVRQNGWAIEYIPNPSDSVQTAAVQNTAMVIELIKNPTPAAQLAAVQQNGGAIKYIRNPSEHAALIAILGMINNKLYDTDRFFKMTVELEIQRLNRLHPDSDELKTIATEIGVDL